MVVPPSRIEIVHTQPWRGRIVLRFASSAGGTRVSLQAELDRHGMEWLMRRRGHAVRHPATGNPRLGLLTSKSGPASLFAAATDSLASLAITEVNAEGGIGGRPVELIVGDDATDPAVGIAEAHRLVRLGCRTILVATTSATFFAVSDVLADADVLVVQTVMNEGGARGRLRVQLGERPADQLAQAAHPMMGAAGGRRWFLAGNDYCWPRSTHAVAKEILPQVGGRLVGERYVGLGTADYSPVIEAITRSGADVVLSTFVGADAAAFQRQAHELGLHERCLTLAPALDESTLARIGSPATAGVHTISGYLESLETERNFDLLARYREAFGRWAPPLSTLSESVYEGVHIWWCAVRRAGTEEPRAVADAMRGARYELPRGTVVLNKSNRVVQRLYLAEAVGTDLQAISPD
ncbi:substrate-binding protein [Pseudonocardia hispaniensis]|uniref:Substrate-binding protein n=1 Tax=Pseudonocardia hispaniensis TaxID=904933 RepID=A0ABW1J0M2_9PSEU